MHILIVDDDEAIRDALREILEDDGHRVSLARHGQQALTFLQQTSERPDLILLDLAMPIMSGWEFRKAQQHDPVLEAIPVVVLSADRSVQQNTAMIEAHAYLAKPVPLDTLLAVVGRFHVG